MLSILKPKKNDKVVAKFVINTLTKISRDTEYESLNENMQSLYSNTAKLPTTLADRKHGHIGIIMKDTLYTTFAMVTPC